MSGLRLQAGSVPLVDDPGAVDALAGDVDHMGAEYARVGGEVHAAWAGLGGLYVAPEAGVVHTAMDRPQQAAGVLAADAGRVSGALSTYASALVGFKARREELLARIAASNASLDRLTGELADAVAANSQSVDAGLGASAVSAAQRGLAEQDAAARALAADIGQLCADIDAAQMACANEIGAVHGGSYYVTAGASGGVVAGYDAEMHTRAILTGQPVDQAAIAVLGERQAAYEAALRDAEEARRVAEGEGPDGFWGHVSSFGRGLKDGVVEPIKLIGDLTGFNGEEAQAELIDGLKATGSQIAGLVSFDAETRAQSRAFVANIASTSWNEFLRDPAYAIGTLVPDLVIGVATAGAGTVAVGAGKTALRTINIAADIAPSPVARAAAGTISTGASRVGSSVSALSSRVSGGVSGAVRPLVDPVVRSASNVTARVADTGASSVMRSLGNTYTRVTAPARQAFDTVSSKADNAALNVTAKAFGVDADEVRFRMEEMSPTRPAPADIAGSAPLNAEENAKWRQIENSLEQEGEAANHLEANARELQPAGVSANSANSSVMTHAPASASSSGGGLHATGSYTDAPTGSGKSGGLHATASYADAPTSGGRSSGGVDAFHPAGDAPSGRNATALGASGYRGVPDGGTHVDLPDHDATSSHNHSDAGDLGDTHSPDSHTPRGEVPEVHSYEPGYQAPDKNRIRMPADYRPMQVGADNPGGWIETRQLAGGGVMEIELTKDGFPIRTQGVVTDADVVYSRYGSRGTEEIKLYVEWDIRHYKKSGYMEGLNPGANPDIPDQSYYDKHPYAAGHLNGVPWSGSSFHRMTHETYDLHHVFGGKFDTPRHHEALDALQKKVELLDTLPSKPSVLETIMGDHWQPLKEIATHEARINFFPQKADINSNDFYHQYEKAVVKGGGGRFFSIELKEIDDRGKPKTVGAGALNSNNPKKIWGDSAFPN